MKSIFNLALDALLFFLSFIVPKKNGTYLLGSGDGTSFKGNPKYLYLYMLQNRKDLSPLWITGNSAVYDELNLKKMPVVYRDSVKGFISILRSRYLVIEIMTKDIMYAGFTATGRFRFIQTFHGMPLKKIANDANEEMKGIGRVRFSGSRTAELILSRFKALLKVKLLYKKYDLITASCGECNDIFRKAFCNNNVETLGFTRNDIFFRKDLREQDFKKKLSLTGYKQIISYVPTFRDIDTGKKPFTDEGLKKINMYLKKNGYVLLVKKHPYDTTLQVSKNFTNIRDVSREAGDIMQLLAVTDILITDYSSVFFDFILTGRPVVFYSYDYPEYMKTCRSMYFDYSGTLPGPFAATEDELLKLLSSCGKWFNKKDYTKKYLEFNQRFNTFHDGNSCERLLDYIQREKL